MFGNIKKPFRRKEKATDAAKYLTFGVEADSVKTAKPRLERVEIDILNNFKRLGVMAISLNGTERLRLLHDIFHMDAPEPFRFSWD